LSKYKVLIISIVAASLLLGLGVFTARVVRSKGGSQCFQRGMMGRGFEKGGIERPEARFEEFLNQDVKEKKITAKQKEAILKKMEEIKKWAKDNKIDLQQIMPGRGYEGFMEGRGGHFMGRRGFKGGFRRDRRW
jgi:hypothetical protein